MEYVTLMEVPEADAPVRRRRVPRAALRYGPVAALALVLGTITLGADWVRLRLEAVEVGALRAKAADDRAALAQLTEQLQALEARVGRVADFERKVRIVADLPGPTLLETSRPALGGPEEEQLVEAGGEEELDSAPDAGQEPADAGRRATPTPGPAAGPAREAGAPAPVSAPPQAWLARAAAARAAGLDGAAVARLRRRVERLLDRAARLDRSLAALVEALGARRERLAAMPSIAPVVGFVTSTFGWRRSPFSGRRQFHAGIDIAAQPGASFVATAGGRVVFAGVKGALGRAVVLDHGHGLQTIYGHAASLSVRAGARVARGDPLGAVGSSGHSTGPHVHYAVTLRGRTVDPADYLLD
jgi:murein DD-endopeptidase MepM/ murein hydrolase activator NlpD